MPPELALQLSLRRSQGESWNSAAIQVGDNSFFSRNKLTLDYCASVWGPELQHHSTLGEPDELHDIAENAWHKGSSGDCCENRGDNALRQLSRLLGLLLWAFPKLLETSPESCELVELTCHFYWGSLQGAASPMKMDWLCKATQWKLMQPPKKCK